MFECTTNLTATALRQPPVGQYSVLIVKPDAVRCATLIERQLWEASFLLLLRTQFSFTKASATAFYGKHEGQPYFPRHVAFMQSGPCVGYLVTSLAFTDVVARLRELVGATDPAQAAEGTLRRVYGTGLPENAVHASSSVGDAIVEASWLFAPRQLVDAGVCVTA